MYLSYIRYTHKLIHNLDPKNRKGDFMKLKGNLKKVYDTRLATLTFPHAMKTSPRSDIEWIIERVIVCKDNKGCNYKKVELNKKDIIDKLVLFHDGSPGGRLLQTGHRNPDNYITVFIHGKWRMNSNATFNNFDIRLFPNMINNVSIGTTEQNLNPLMSATQGIIDNVITPDIKKLLDGLCNGEKEFQSTTPEVTGIAAQGGHIFENMKDNRLPHRIVNFGPVMDLIDDKVPSHVNTFEPTNKKQFNKVYFKPLDAKAYKTIGISVWGYTDIKGARKCDEVRKVFNVFKTAIREHGIEKKIMFDTANFVPLAVKVAAKGCPKGNPEANAKGMCSEGYLPRPNKHGKFCCYKKKLTAAEAFRITQNFEKMQIQMSDELKAFLKVKGPVKGPVAAAKAAAKVCPEGKILNPRTNRCIKIRGLDRANGLPILQNNNGITFRGKKWNCMSLKKPQLQSIAKSLGSGFVVKSTKQILCNDISRLLKEARPRQ